MQIGLAFKEETNEMLCLEQTSVCVEKWTLHKANLKYLESSEMCCWRRIKTSWTDHVRNEEESKRSGISYMQ